MTDDEIVQALRAANPSDSQWRELTREVGPYSITEPRHFTRKFVNLLLSVRPEELPPEHLQDAPRVLSNSFKVPNPFPHDPKKPGQREITVMFASVAACIEREANSLRARFSPQKRTE